RRRPGVAGLRRIPSSRVNGPLIWAAGPCEVLAMGLPFRGLGPGRLSLHRVATRGRKSAKGGPVSACRRRKPLGYPNWPVIWRWRTAQPHPRTGVHQRFGELTGVAGLIRRSSVCAALEDRATPTLGDPVLTVDRPSSAPAIAPFVSVSPPFATVSTTPS